MAITYELIGQLGGGLSEATEHPAVFSDGSLRVSQLNTNINLEQGDYLFAWKAEFRDNPSEIRINGVPTKIMGNYAGTKVGGFEILRGISKIEVRGTGYIANTPFFASPEFVVVKIQ